MRICIVGGGIAGLSLAALLKQRNISVTLVEQAPEWKHIGFGLSIWENGRRVLREIGVDHHIVGKEYLIPSEGVLATSGRMLQTLSLEFFGDNRPVMIHRADLHEALLSQLSGVNVHLGTTVTTIEQSGGGVQVQFSNGARETFDFLVGA